MANDPQSSFSDRVGNTIDGAVTNVKEGIVDTIESTGFGKALRAFGLLAGAIPQSGTGFTAANWGSTVDLDWRVRLSMPNKWTTSPMLQPLLETNGFMFPYTPQIVVEHSANYNALHPTHSNYPFPAYQNSQVSSMTLIGEFTVENEVEGAYWIAATHYLRSVTKMAYGLSSDQGSPPPVVKLNGYGDYVFNQVPVVIQSFTIDMPQDVDYIQVGVGNNGSWVPTRSQVSVVVQPVYSRKSVSEFSLDAFVNGSYVVDGKGFI